MIKKRILRIMLLMFVCFFATACNDGDSNMSLSHRKSDSSKEKSQQQENSTTMTQKDRIVVYVNGAVKNPGVYTLQAGDRIYQAVEMAGGMTSKAKEDALNLAETVSDAQNIYIMTKKEYKINHESKDSISKKDRQDANIEFVNINTADVEQLTTLPGIGKSKATAIVTYREENGMFASKEDIKNVSGIGDATYANIEELIEI